MIVLLVSHVGPDKASSPTHRKLPYEYETCFGSVRFTASTLHSGIEAKLFRAQIALMLQWRATFKQPIMGLVSLSH
jgi:hypothetical protein